MQIFYSPTYGAAAHAFDTTLKALDIAHTVRNEIEAARLDAELVEPTSATPDELERIHDAAYVEAVRTGSPVALASSQGFTWDEGLWHAVTASTGGVRDAALHAYRHRSVAGSLSSGLHHARSDRGAGFCTFNGLVVAADAVVQAGARRVLIIDVDAHCGGGTASLIADRPQIEQIDVSPNAYDRYESTERARLTIVHDGTGYLAAVQDALDSVVDPATVDLVILNAGMDAHEDDSGAPGITDEVLVAREQSIFGWADAYDLPVAFVMAGGYADRHHDRHAVVELHMSTIRAASDSAAARSRRPASARRDERNPS